MLPFYKEYFGMPYSLPKLDIVALPVLAPNAMENWGLVTFRLAKVKLLTITVTTPIVAVHNDTQMLQ